MFRVIFVCKGVIINRNYFDVIYFKYLILKFLTFDKFPIVVNISLILKTENSHLLEKCY